MVAFLRDDVCMMVHCSAEYPCDASACWPSLTMHSRTHVSLHAGPWWQDPRIPELGLRGLFDAQQLPPPPPEAGGTSSRKQRAAGMSVVNEDAHRRWRYQLGIAEGDTDIPSGRKQLW